MKVVYFQPRLHAGKNYRNSAGREQVWTPWWALLVHQHARTVCDGATLIDGRVDEGWRATLAAELGPEVVLACSVMTGNAIVDAITASRIGRERGATVIWGGPHPTLFAAQVAAEPFVDQVIQGFGAQVFARTLAALRTGLPISPVADSRGTAGPTPVTLLKGPVVAAPFVPALDLVRDWSPYVNSDQALGDRVVNIVTSEGCLRRCTYCSEPQTSGHSWLTYDVTQCVEAATEVLHRASASALKLHDPNFLHDLDRAKRFARLMRALRPVHWAATIHPADLLDLSDADLAELADSGLCRVLVGLESPLPELARLAGKAYDTSRIDELAAKLDRHGIAGMFTFIVGWPGAATNHYAATVEAAYKIRAIAPRHQAKIHFLEPWPGTPIYTLLMRSMPQAPKTLDEWALIDYYFASLPGLHDPEWEQRIRQANEELSPYVEA